MRFSISLAALAVLVPLAAGCSSEDCGPGDAAVDGIALSVDGSAANYGNFTSSANNDCPAAGHPTSLTIQAEQVSPPTSTSFHLTLCLPRPDEISGDPIPVGDAESVIVVDASGEIDGCRLFRDPAKAATGTVTFLGFCGDGTGEAGYALALDAAIPGFRSCTDDDADQPVTLEFSGRAAVDAL